MNVDKTRTNAAGFIVLAPYKPQKTGRLTDCFGRAI